MVMNFTVFDTNLHMVNHYRRINSAKSVVNTSTPRCYLSRPKSASSKSLTSRYSTPSVLSTYELPSRTNSNCDCRRLKQNKHKLIATERSLSVPPHLVPKIKAKFAPPKNTKIKSKPVDNKSKKYSLTPTYFSAVSPKSVSALSPNSVSTKSTGSTYNSAKRMSIINHDISHLPEQVNTKRPVPTPRSLSSKSKSSPKHKIVPNYEYLQFSLRITEDIIRNDLYSQNEMRRVFNSHIEANRGRLSMSKMLHHIEHLCKELNITKKVSSLSFTEKNTKCCQTDSKQTLIDKINNGQYVIDEKEIQELSEDDLQAVISGILCEVPCNSVDSDQESDKSMELNGICPPPTAVTNRQDNGDLSNDSQVKQSLGSTKEEEDSFQSKTMTCSCSSKEDTVDTNTTVKEAGGDNLSLKCQKSDSSCYCSIEDVVDCSTTCLMANQQQPISENNTETELANRNFQLVQAEENLKNVISSNSSKSTKCCSFVSQICLKCPETSVKPTTSAPTEQISLKTIIETEAASDLGLEKINNDQYVIDDKKMSENNIQEGILSEALYNSEESDQDTQLEQEASKSSLTSKIITQTPKPVDIEVSIQGKHLVTTDSSLHYDLIDVEKYNQVILKLGVDKCTQTTFSIEKVQFVKPPSLSSTENLTGKCNKVEFDCMPPPIIEIPKSDTCNSCPSRNVESNDHESLIGYLNNIYSNNIAYIEPSKSFCQFTNNDLGEIQYESAFEYTRTNVEQSSYLPNTCCESSNKNEDKNGHNSSFEYTSPTTCCPLSNKNDGEHIYKSTITTIVEQSSNIPTNEDVAKTDYKSTVHATCVPPNPSNKKAGTTEYKSAYKSPKRVKTPTDCSQKANKNSEFITAIKKLTLENANALSEIMQRHPYIPNATSGIDKYKVQLSNTSAKPVVVPDVVNSTNSTLSEGETCVCPPLKQCSGKENVLERLKKYEKRNLPENTQNERRDIKISNYELRSVAGPPFRRSYYYPNCGTQTSFNSNSQMLDKYSVQKENNCGVCPNCDCGDESVYSDGEMMNTVNYDDTSRSTSPNT